MLDSMIKHKRTNFVCQTVAFFCTTAIALFVPFFGLVVSFIGCFAVSGYSFILPPLFHWQLCRKESSNCSACLDFFCFLLGIVTVCVTSYQSALAIAEQL
jgi:amino acid permease